MYYASNGITTLIVQISLLMMVYVCLYINTKQVIGVHVQAGTRQDYEMSYEISEEA